MIYISAGWTPATPANHPRIAWESYIQHGTAVVTASTSATDYPVTALENALTYDRWRPTSVPAYINIDLGDNSSAVDYVGIAAHTLTGFGVQVQAGTDGVSYSNISTVQTPTDNSAILFLFNAATYRYWRIAITGTGIPSVGVVYIGTAMAMERSIYGGHSPITLSRQTIVAANVSEAGQWLGRSVVRRNLTGSAAFKNLTPTFYRNEFDQFVRSARTYPFFFAWRPQAYTADVAYCWTEQDIQPQNNGIRNLMDVSFDMVGYDGD
jgi:hypothetical protein